MIKKSEKKNKSWKKMEIYKVALNPEQAVLTCCDSSGKGVLSWMGPGQCWATIFCGDGTGSETQSS